MDNVVATRGSAEVSSRREFAPTLARQTQGYRLWHGHGPRHYDCADEVAAMHSHRPRKHGRKGGMIEASPHNGPLRSTGVRTACSR